MAKPKKMKRIGRQEELTADITYEIDKAIREEKSDRATALIAAAYVELRLRFAIEKRLVDDPEIAGLLFNEYGPLYMLHARIYAAYALGCFKERSFADLRLMREIRNQFAHAVEPITFEHPDIKARCALFFSPTKIQPMPYANASPWPPQAPRDQYVATAMILANGLFTEAVRHERGITAPHYLNF